MPWAMTPWSLSYINKTFTCTAGVSFSCLSPFLLRYILSCLQSSFSIKNETDRDRTVGKNGWNEMVGKNGWDEMVGKNVTIRKNGWDEMAGQNGWDEMIGKNVWD